MANRDSRMAHIRFADLTPAQAHALFLGESEKFQRSAIRARSKACENLEQRRAYHGIIRNKKANIAMVAKLEKEIMFLTVMIDGPVPEAEMSDEELLASLGL